MTAPSKWGMLIRRAHDDRGTALIEFAFVLPILLIIYVGGIQLMDKISCSRKVTITTRAIADLVSQNMSGSMTASELDSNLAASTQVMVPYPVSKALVRVTEVTTDSSFNSTVVWSRAINGTPYRAGIAITIPANMRVPGAYLVFSEVQYTYTPFIKYGASGSQILKDSLYMLPRNNNSITCSDCTS